MNRTNTHSPIYICGEDWSLDIQSSPTFKAITTGRPPSYLEFIDAIKMTNFPILAIEAIYAAVYQQWLRESEGL